MSEVLHGGGVDRAMRDLGFKREQLCDFSASINPLGAPPEVHQAIQQALERIGDYPEIGAESLCADLAKYHRLAEQNLLPGSGSTELIYLLPRVLRPRRALLVHPCFGEYAPALRQVGCRINSFELKPEEEFYFSVDWLLERVGGETDLVVLANPGNPSGVPIPPGRLMELADRLGDCRLLIDEAFVDFCPDYSVLTQVAERDNLLVLRSLTKFYAIPGVRAGYLAGGREDVVRLAAAQEPWRLSNLAIAAAKACLAAVDYRERTLAAITTLRTELAQELEGIGLRVFNSAANYLLCRLPENAPPAAQLAEQLRSQGLLVRCCSDFQPLDRRYLRLAVLNRTQNQRLLEALARMLA